MAHEITALLLLLLTAFAGCTQPAETAAPTEENIPTEPETPRLPEATPGFNESWYFEADLETPAIIEFRPPAEMSLNFTATIYNFVGSNLSIELPMGCGDLAENISPMQTTIESDRNLGTIRCFVNRDTHEIRIQVNGVAEGIVSATASN